MEITYELVNEAYLATELKPTDGYWVTETIIENDVGEDTVVNCACGMSALYTHLKVKNENTLTVNEVFRDLMVCDSFNDIDTEVINYLSSLGINEDSIEGFIDGFDGTYFNENAIRDNCFSFAKKSEDGQENYLVGWKVGDRFYNELHPERLENDYDIRTVDIEEEEF